MTFIGNNQFSFKTPEDRYWSKVEKKPAPECWEWKGHKNIDEHGRFILNGKAIMAYRYAWELEYGPIPKGISVLHHCDNGGCVNPAHLFLGTQFDNIQDAKTKGHYRGVNAGEKAGLAKLTWEKIFEIRSSRDSARELGRKYSVNRKTIYDIRRGTTWKMINYHENEVTGSE